SSEKLGMDAQERIEAALRRVADSGQSVIGQLAIVSGLIPGPGELTFQQCEVLREALASVAITDRLPQSWWAVSSKELSEHVDLFRRASTLAAELAAKQSQLDEYMSLRPRQARDFLSPIESAFAHW